MSIERSTSHVRPPRLARVQGGAKGLGEVDTVGDALAQLGVRHDDIPITDERIWTLLRDHAGRTDD